MLTQRAAIGTKHEHICLDQHAPDGVRRQQFSLALAEEIVECYRDIDELLVIGGVLWGNNPADDYFLKNHGVATPDALWKVIIRGKHQPLR